MVAKSNLGVLEELAGTVGRAKLFDRLNTYVLLEVVRDLARAQPDPEAYIAGVFDRVASRARFGTTEREAGLDDSDFRSEMAQFFSVAAHGLGRSLR